ncbi:hypothetical protein HBI56_202670 [Parastagonospora nodorum]|nr:hypothetical protein HBH53_108660 [Parastagonospora nodorum]KAH3970816.1 hypothetical protein HBH52_162880 [Parastagonospora nodorum]KAH4065254.1 hypothetical protein HBH50_163920 [Parastagonospora nodorum]KAH4084653.1 hypothetical protein HBH48_161650 [Parastagonospora nodorum]KAH4180920.1 hypothetical protein HBH43_011050 [Parastagonospora nodorum]
MRNPHPGSFESVLWWFPCRFTSSSLVPTKNSEPGRQFSVMSDDSICGGCLGDNVTLFPASTPLCILPRASQPHFPDPGPGL